MHPSTMIRENLLTFPACQGQILVSMATAHCHYTSGGWISRGKTLCCCEAISMPSPNPSNIVVTNVYLMITSANNVALTAHWDLIHNQTSESLSTVSVPTWLELIRWHWGNGYPIADLAVHYLPCSAHLKILNHQNC